jgi:two-component system nitrogen regulation response regulator NtrX
VIQSDFRVICATNRNLEEMVKKGEFKEDLLQRLNVLPVELCPLRERTEDIPLLVEHFLSRQNGFRPGLRFTDEALDVLRGYPWPGNIRELSNMIAYVATMAENNEVEIADLPPKFRNHPRGTPNSALSEGTESGSSATSFYDRIAKVEKEILSAEYARHDGNISRLAMALGMDRSHLYTKLKEHKIHITKK